MNTYYQFHPASASADALLMERVSLHDSRSLAILYAKYHRKIHSIIIKIVRREIDANEILQDVFMQVWQKASAYDSRRSPFLNWLVTIAHNASLNFIRSARVKRIRREDKYDYEQFAFLIS